MVTAINYYAAQNIWQWTSKKLHTSAHWFTTMADIEVHLMGDFRAFTSSIDWLRAKECRDSNENERKNNATEHGGYKKEIGFDFEDVAKFNILFFVRKAIC